jgi:hypothetical protein
LARQRITIAKIGGVSADVVLRRIQAWSTARISDDPNEWSSDQWPAELRLEVDQFADRLRTHGFASPVVHFVEWADMWSMGDLFLRWLRPSGCAASLQVFSDRCELFAYELPDNRRLETSLAGAGPQQFPETDWFVRHLLEAVRSWDKMVDSAALVVLRHVLDASTLDEEVTASMKKLPEWLS